MQIFAVSVYRSPVVDSPEITCFELNRKDTSSLSVWVRLFLTSCWVETRPCEMQRKLRTRRNHALHFDCGWLLHQQTTILRQQVHQWKWKQHANCLFKIFFFSSTPLLQVVLVAFHRTDCATQTSCGVFPQQTTAVDCLVSSIQTTHKHTHLQMTMKPTESILMFANFILIFIVWVSIDHAVSPPFLRIELKQNILFSDAELQWSELFLAGDGDDQQEQDCQWHNLQSFKRLNTWLFFLFFSGRFYHMPTKKELPSKICSYFRKKMQIA